MIIGNSGLEQLVSHAVGAIGRKTLGEVSQDSFGAMAAAGLGNGAFPVTSQTANAASTDDAQSNSGYNESFARMMVNLKSGADTSLSRRPLIAITASPARMLPVPALPMALRPGSRNSWTP